MKAKYWKSYIIEIVQDGKAAQIDLLSKLLEEADEAKQELRNKGYGWTGLSLLKTIQEEVENKE